MPTPLFRTYVWRIAHGLIIRIVYDISVITIMFALCMIRHLSFIITFFIMWVVCVQSCGFNFDVNPIHPIDLYEPGAYP